MSSSSPPKISSEKDQLINQWTIPEKLKKLYPSLVSKAETGSIVAAIKLHCLECVGCSITRVRDCDLYSCALWPFRFGKNPFRKGRKFTEEEKEKARERFTQLHKTKKGEANV